MKRKSAFLFCATAAISAVIAIIVFLFLMDAQNVAEKVHPNYEPIINIASPTNYVYNISTNIVNVNSSCVITNRAVIADGMITSEEEDKNNFEKRRNDSLRALFAINHVNWVVTKIKNYNDPSVLEEEYKNISADALDLNAIKDQEIIELICDIMDVITDMRIEEKEREMLKEELDQGMSDALFDSLTSVASGALVVNPVSAIFSVLTSAATTAVSYKRAKRQMMAAYGKKTWALDKNRMRYLNELNKSLLQKYWAIVQRYDLPDRYRVTESDVALLIEHLKDQDSKRRHSFLKALENKYTGLQNYWYYRGLAAYESKDFEDANYALACYQKAQEECGAILRVDSIAAKVAMLQIQMMINSGDDNAQAYRKQLEIIEKNTLIDEWQILYFCAAVYINNVGDLREAERVLAPLITHLEFQRTQRLVDWQELVSDNRDFGTTNKVDRMPASGDALFDCRKLLAEAEKGVDQERYQKKLEEICNGAQASARDKLFCYFSMSYDRALGKIAPDIKNIRVLRDDGEFKVSLPMSWVASREGESRLNVGKISTFDVESFDLSKFETLTESKERTVQERSDGTVCALIDYGSPKGIKANEVKRILYTTRYDRGTDKAKDQGLMLVVEFDANSQDKFLMPQKAYMGKWHLGSGLTDKSHWTYKENTTESDYVSIEL